MPSSSKKKKKNPCNVIDDVEFDFYKTKRRVLLVVDEMERFCKSDVDTEYTSLDGHFDILAFWKDREKFYPIARVAWFTLACPASSAPAERSFSQAGWTINVRCRGTMECLTYGRSGRRCSLDVCNLNKTIT